MGNRSRSSERYRKRNRSRSRSRDSIRKDSHRDRRSDSHSEKRHHDKYRDHRCSFHPSNLNVLRDRSDNKKRESDHHSRKHSGHSDDLNRDYHRHGRDRYDKYRSSDKYSETHRDGRRDRESTSRSVRGPRGHRSPSYSKGPNSGYKRGGRRGDSRSPDYGRPAKRERRSLSVSLGHSDGEHEVAEELKDEEELLRSMMGISSFETTKNKKHEETSVSGVKKKSKRKYRQYMNRRGGFNHPLSPVF
ncbi:cyclophilin-RNA interacting protein [Theileria orientalis strain Shintoku]|uniref:Cyclophilin-RNA interacting protein n=1 Tax=Theileria orientalis strain Shintoku TaxID=869250 RepID=J4CD02_THEOR|nr:cyclophilin-RNA interacting protein [Theileria orientalis strain Shintoku]PVC51615.1 cyclophilin-RNA interacting protein [Theileria orientalis]BAM40287.1 cyclophilin-RNA interacting protein [Theileria orientalis strain Shintoku]|eukprot:XP_009690588.1 cyclophilin-RNA interacting protein [Theileria orientalis strain Shintoku]